MNFTCQQHQSCDLWLLTIRRINIEIYFSVCLSYFIYFFWCFYQHSTTMHNQSWFVASPLMTHLNFMEMRKTSTWCDGWENSITTHHLVKWNMRLVITLNENRLDIIYIITQHNEAPIHKATSILSMWEKNFPIINSIFRRFTNFPTVFPSHWETHSAHSSISIQFSTSLHQQISFRYVFFPFVIEFLSWSMHEN